MMRRVPPRGAGPAAQLDQRLSAYYRGLSDGRVRRLGVVVLVLVAVLGRLLVLF